LFFVDAANKKVYGNALENLENDTVIDTITGTHTYPLRQKEIIYFPLSNMKQISALTEKQAEMIRKYNTKNYNGAWRYLDG
jgi:phosphoribosylpyrophosphate synthetase